MTTRMTLKKRRIQYAAVALMATLIGAVAWAADLLTVVEREAAIRKDKRSYSPRLATVKEGEQVALIAREPPWLRVEFRGVQGWLTESSVTADPDVVLSREAVASGVRPTEQSAARRGFSPEVEKEYKTSKPELEAAYALVDQIVGWTYTDEQVMAFLEAGKISPPAEGGSK